MVGPDQSSSSTLVLPSKTVATPAFSMQGRTLRVNFVGHARVDVFNLTGSLVKPLWNGHLDGKGAFGLQGIPDGAYVVRIQTANSTVMQKIRLQ